MPDHPLLLTVQQGVRNAEDHARAAADAQRLDALVAEALALPPTEASADRLHALVVAFEQGVQPYLVNFGAVPLVPWVEAQRRVLYAHAVRMVGHARAHLVAQAPTPPLGPGGPAVLPSVAAPRDLRWMHRL